MMPSEKRPIDLRVLPVHVPSEDDLRRARDLPRDACPRRHCWWWRSASFDWDVSVSDGCTYPASEYAALTGDTSPCRRCNPSGAVDHYEPRDPAADGFDEGHWS